MPWWKTEIRCGHVNGKRKIALAYAHLSFSLFLGSSPQHHSGWTHLSLSTPSSMNSITTSFSNLSLSEGKDGCRRSSIHHSDILVSLMGGSCIASKCTIEVLTGANVVLARVLKLTTADDEPDNCLEEMRTSVGRNAVRVAESISQSPSSTCKKTSWKSLQTSAESLHVGSSWESSALAISLVFGGLSLLQSQYGDIDSDPDTKAAASALSSTTSRKNPLLHSGRCISTLFLEKYLIHAAHSDVFDLQILNHFARAFKITGEDNIEPHVTAAAINNALRKAGNLNDMVVTVFDKYKVISYKKKISGAMALACQLQPWSVLSPEPLVEASVPFEFWHAAEIICRSAYKASSSAARVRKEQKSSCDKNRITFSQESQRQNVKRAVERLIDAAMEDRKFRRADALSTNLYEAGGRSRYVEARFNHACETISKVVLRRQISIVDRQIERIDKAVEKVKQDQVQSSTPSDSMDSNPRKEIRKFAIQKLQEAGDITSAYRLANVFGFDYVYDERAITLAAAIRRRSYLQFEDVLSGSIPSLIATPKGLCDSFEKLRHSTNKNGPFGMDAEWDDETQGVAVLQVANANMVVLIDVPALLATNEGVKAMESTVGKLLDCSESVVAGFGCRQDLSRLQSSPIVAEIVSRHHWFLGTRAVVDVQSMVGRVEPKLYKVSLSRVCQHYIGKLLDKREQCSLWSGRPLSEDQRSYAALDAWVCVAIYQKVATTEESFRLKDQE